MTNLKWLDRYAGQSTEELLALEGTYRVDSLILAFEQAIAQKAENVGLDALTETEVTVLAVEALEREVNNGGYAQFFGNSSAVFTPVVVDALTRIGCSKTASVTARAVAAVGLTTDANPMHVQAAISREDPDRDRRLKKCDGEYFANAEDIAGMLFSHIKAQQQEVRLRSGN